MTILVKIDTDIELELLSPEHNSELFVVIDGNRRFLREWLPWVDGTISPANTATFLRGAMTQYQSGRGPQYAIFYRSMLCGVCGFHPIDLGRKVAAIGYWLAEDATGKGIITRTVQALLGIGFRDYGLDKIEISCATENYRSRAIPERLGFTLEGIARQQERLYHGEVDHAIYALRASDWAKMSGTKA